MCPRIAVWRGKRAGLRGNRPVPFGAQPAGVSGAGVTGRPPAFAGNPAPDAPQPLRRNRRPAEAAPFGQGGLDGRDSACRLACGRGVPQRRSAPRPGRNAAWTAAAQRVRHCAAARHVCPELRAGEKAPQCRQGALGRRGRCAVFVPSLCNVARRARLGQGTPSARLEGPGAARSLRPDRASCGGWRGTVAGFPARGGGRAPGLAAAG